MLSRPTQGAVSGDLSHSKSLLFRALGPSDAGDYARRVGTDSSSTFRRRLSEATKCYAVEMDGRIVHASWVTTACAWTREVRADLCVGAGHAYVYESFTHPDARGRGVYPFALDEICKELGRRGIESLVVAVESTNGASLRAVAKAGFHEKFRLRYRRRLGRIEVEVPPGVERDTKAATGLEKDRIWLTRDGASKQGER